MNDQTNVQERLTNVEDRLGRLENLLVSINEKLDQTHQPSISDAQSTEKFQQWVTDYVSMRLQQLVPETCDHPAERHQCMMVLFLTTRMSHAQKRSCIVSNAFQSRLSGRWLCNAWQKMHVLPR